MEAISEPINQLLPDINDETRIRRPPNAFMIFGKQYRKILATKFGNLSNKQISKILGDEWKKMDANTKSHYHSLAKQVYETHLQKYPDYHYNPLEARQRKAERKRKYKTSRVSQRTKSNAQFIVPVVKPFGGNRSIAFPNTTFAFQTPTVRYIQPIINKGNGDSVIGIKRLNHSFKSGDHSRDVIPIEHKEHSYSFQPKMESFFEDNCFVDNSEQKINEIEVQTQQTDNQIDWNQSFDFLVNFLPPMLNPNTEVTQVLQDLNQTSNENSMPQNDFQFIKEENIEEDIENVFTNNKCVIGERVGLFDFIKTEIKTEPIDEQFDQLFDNESETVIHHSFQ